jgi:DNA-binding transcriptional ArsR family regulator
LHAFDVLGDPVRRRILELLATNEHNSGAVVAVIQEEFGITQAAVSQHLRVLRDNGFATVRVDGARRVYSLNAEPLAEVDAWLDRFRIFWGRNLDALATEVARGKRDAALRDPALRDSALREREVPDDQTANAHSATRGHADRA